MTGPFATLSAVPAGTPVRVVAAMGERRWWARIRQFRRTAYVEVWNDAGFDAEAVVPTDDVAGAMAASLLGRTGALPVGAADVLFRAAATFAAASGRIEVVAGPTTAAPARPTPAERLRPAPALLPVAARLA